MSQLRRVTEVRGDAVAIVMVEVIRYIPVVKAAARAVAAKTVLVADDTAFVRDRFQRALEEAGHRAVTVRTAQDLLTQLRALGSDVDLLIVDLRLPHGHGASMVRAIRALAPPVPPIVVFSGTVASADEVRQLAAIGIAGYVNEYTAAQHIVPSIAPHLFPAQHTRRSSPRVTLTIPVSYRFGNTIAAACTLNISSGGVAVRTTNPLAIGTPVRMRLRVPGSAKDADVEARVAWSDRRIGMGLQFTTVAAGDQAAIDGFVESHFFTNRKA